MLLRLRLMAALVLVVLFVRAMITTSDPSPVGLALREQAKGFRESPSRQRGDTPEGVAPCRSGWADQLQPEVLPQPSQT